jgi:hypothetical protein
MSFRERVERVTDQHYVLPRSREMRVDVHAFLSPALLAQTDEALWRQAAEAGARARRFCFRSKARMHPAAP